MLRYKLSRCISRKLSDTYTYRCYRGEEMYELENGSRALFNVNIHKALHYAEDGIVFVPRTSVETFVSTYGEHDHKGIVKRVEQAAEFGGLDIRAVVVPYVHVEKYSYQNVGYTDPQYDDVYLMYKFSFVDIEDNLLDVLKKYQDISLEKLQKRFSGMSRVDLFRIELFDLGASCGSKEAAKYAISEMIKEATNS